MEKKNFLELFKKYLPPKGYEEILLGAENIRSRADKQQRILEIHADFNRLISKKDIYAIEAVTRAADRHTARIPLFLDRHTGAPTVILAHFTSPSSFFYSFCKNLVIYSFTKPKKDVIIDDGNKIIFDKGVQKHEDSC